jgi:hypothetical protein
VTKIEVLGGFFYKLFCFFNRRVGNFWIIGNTALSPPQQDQVQVMHWGRSDWTKMRVWLITPQNVKIVMES